MNIIDINIQDIKEYENNPRFNDNAVDAVAKSIEEFGFKVPIILDKNNIIVAGHTRLKAAKQLGLNIVPCLVADDLTEEQIKAFRLADNKVGELAEWDFIKLEEELRNIQNIDMSSFEFDMSFFDEELQADDDEFDVEEALEEIEEPITNYGDIYQLGEHKLICGDSTLQEDVSKLMNNKLADLLLTDPPYNVAVENSQGMTIKNDDMSNEDFKRFLHKAFKNASNNLKKGGAFYIWHGDSETVNFRNACTNNDLLVKQCLIWVKNGMIMGRQDYQWKHEPCLYGWKEGASHYFIDDRTQETVIEDKINVNSLKKEEMKELIKQLLDDRVSTTIIREDKPLKNTDHPTMKPIKLLSRQIKNSTKKGELILDLFGGSGSTLICAEQLDRTCYMVEYDPKYCDVIVKRWETLTGRKAELING